MPREKETRKQIEYEIVLLDELVPQDHILRKIEAAVDFSFIHDLCKEQRLGHLPKYMGLDAGYHSAWVAHLLEKNGIQGVIGYRRHTHKTEHYGKYRFKYDWDYDVYTCRRKTFCIGKPPRVRATGNTSATARPAVHAAEETSALENR